MTGNKEKKLKLKPSLREKNRYLLFEYQDIGKNKTKEVIDKAILDFVGVLGYSKACPRIIKLGKKNKKEVVEVILSVKRKELDKVKAALLFSDIKIKRISGTVAGLSKQKDI